MADKKSFSPFDKYDFEARIVPALVVLAPLMALVVIWWPALWTLAGSLASAGLALALLVCLAYLVGSMGVDLEKRWGEAIGSPHSARLLSHKDQQISSVEKAEIHAFLDRHNQSVPSAADEEIDDAAAQRTRIVRVKWLIVVSRPQAGPSLLLKENIAYGFWRNLRALRTAGFVLVVLVLAIDAYLLYRTGQADQRFPAAIALLVLGTVVGLFFLFAVTRARVIGASLGYAIRLFSLRNNPDVIAYAAKLRPPAPAGDATTTP